jgi:hypothetical protein
VFISFLAFTLADVVKRLFQNKGFQPECHLLLNNLDLIQRVTIEKESKVITVRTPTSRQVLQATAIPLLPISAKKPPEPADHCKFYRSTKCGAKKLARQHNALIKIQISKCTFHVRPENMRADFARAIADFYEYNNKAPTKPFSVNMEHVYERFPELEGKLETMGQWAKRQYWGESNYRPAFG